MSGKYQIPVRPRIKPGAGSERGACGAASKGRNTQASCFDFEKPRFASLNTNGSEACR